MKIIIDTENKSISFNEPIGLSILRNIINNLSSSIFKDNDWVVLPQTVEERKKFNYSENNG